MDLHESDLGGFGSPGTKGRQGESTDMAGGCGDWNRLKLGIVDCLAELRRVVEDLKPGLLALFGFSAAVEGYLEGSIADLEPRLRLSFDGSIGEVPSTFWTKLRKLRSTALHRNQSATRSATASPKKIAVELRPAAGLTAILISDFGRGGNGIRKGPFAWRRGAHADSRLSNRGYYANRENTGQSRNDGCDRPPGGKTCRASCRATRLAATQNV